MSEKCENCKGAGCLDCKGSGFRDTNPAIISGLRRQLAQGTKRHVALQADYSEARTEIAEQRTNLAQQQEEIERLTGILETARNLDPPLIEGVLAGAVGQRSQG